MQKKSLTALVGAVGAVCLVAAGQVVTSAQAEPLQVAQASADPDFDTLYAEGEDLYNRNCAGCHAADGTGDENGLPGPKLVGNNFLSSAGAIIGQIMVGNYSQLDAKAIELGLYDDGRSDNKGVEPEGVVLGSIGGRTLAFIGLEFLLLAELCRRGRIEVRSECARLALGLAAGFARLGFRRCRSHAPLSLFLSSSVHFWPVDRRMATST